MPPIPLGCPVASRSLSEPQKDCGVTPAGSAAFKEGAGKPGRHFAGSFTLAGTHSRFPRGCARRSALPLPPLPASCLRLLPLPPPSTLSPSVWSWARSPQFARALDVGAGEVHGASTQDGQPLHQRCGHRGLEPAECGHPGDAGGGVRVLQVRTQPFSSLLLPSHCRVGSARDTPRLGADEKLRDEWQTAQLWVWSHSRVERHRTDSGN